MVKESSEYLSCYCCFHLLSSFCKAFLQPFNLNKILFLNKESYFSAAKNAIGKNANWSLVSILLVVMIIV
jgi:hypothetical protein